MLRAVGLIYVDTNPPKIVDDESETVLMHGWLIQGMPAFETKELFSLIELRKKALAADNPVRATQELVMIAVKDAVQLKLWYNRLGHCPYNKIIQMAKYRAVENLHIDRALLAEKKKDIPDKCHICKMANLKKVISITSEQGKSR